MEVLARPLIWKTAVTLRAGRLIPCVLFLLCCLLRGLLKLLLLLQCELLLVLLRSTLILLAGHHVLLLLLLCAELSLSVDEVSILLVSCLLLEMTDLRRRRRVRLVQLWLILLHAGTVRRRRHLQAQRIGHGGRGHPRVGSEVEVVVVLRRSRRQHNRSSEHRRSH